MAVKTLLDVVKEVCYRINEPAPSALASTTDPNNLQWRELLFEVGESVRDKFDYPTLKRKYTFATVSGQKFYPLPGDFYRLLFGTQWDDTNSWALFGPVTDSSIAARDKGVVLNDTQFSFRVAGAPFDALGETSFDYGGGYIEISPSPNDVRTLSIEYIGANWFYPAQWLASTSYTSGGYFSASRNIYKATSTASSNTVRPSGESGAAATYGIDYQLWRDAYNVIVSDSDYPLIDPHTLKLGLRAAWLRGKGLDDSLFEERFRQSAIASQGRFQGLQGTNSDGDALYEFPWLSEDYVATGF